MTVLGAVAAEGHQAKLIFERAVMGTCFPMYKILCNQGESPALCIYGCNDFAQQVFTPSPAGCLSEPSTLHEQAVKCPVTWQTLGSTADSY